MCNICKQLHSFVNKQYYLRVLKQGKFRYNND